MKVNKNNNSSCTLLNFQISFRLFEPNKSYIFY